MTDGEVMTRSFAGLMVVLLTGLTADKGITPQFRRFKMPILTAATHHADTRTVCWGSRRPTNAIGEDRREAGFQIFNGQRLRKFTDKAKVEDRQRPQSWFTLDGRAKLAQDPCVVAPGGGQASWAGGKRSG